MACRHIVTQRALSGWIRDTATTEGADLAEIERLLKMRARETATATACLRALRLTRQAQAHQRTAGRAVRAYDGPAPWEARPKALWEVNE